MPTEAKVQLLMLTHDIHHCGVLDRGTLFAAAHHQRLFRPLMQRICHEGTPLVIVCGLAWRLHKGGHPSTESTVLTRRLDVLLLRWSRPKTRTWKSATRTLRGHGQPMSTPSMQLRQSSTTSSEGYVPWCLSVSANTYNARCSGQSSVWIL
jgi:hypothetical protein